MNKASELAAVLSNRPYLVIVRRDETTDGIPVFVASHPELADCIAQGFTPVEAIEELNHARFDYITSLVDDGLPVPEPGQTHSTMTSASAGFEIVTNVSHKVAEPAVNLVYNLSDVSSS
jgi:predicted RNase H-like HicB family nuclease